MVPSPPVAYAHRRCRPAGRRSVVEKPCSPPWRGWAAATSGRDSTAGPSRWCSPSATTVTSIVAPRNVVAHPVTVTEASGLTAAESKNPKPESTSHELSIPASRASTGTAMASRITRFGSRVRMQTLRQSRTGRERSTRRIRIPDARAVGSVGCHLGHGLDHLFRGDVPDVGVQRPLVAEGVLDDSHPVTVELVSGFAQQFRPCGNGLLDR